MSNYAASKLALKRGKNPSIKTVSGHAMIEFIIIALFLTPLLLCLPYIAKFYEIKHRTTQMANYITWEDTVYGSIQNQGNQKTIEQLQSDTIDRFLTTANQLLVTDNAEKSNKELTWDPLLESFANSGKQSTGIINLNGIELSSTAVKNDSLLQKALSASVSPLSLTGFSIDTNGLKQFSATVPISYPKWLNSWLGTETKEMVFEQQVTMYTDSWNTSSISHQTDMVSSLMPSRIIPARLVTRVLSITSRVMPWTSKWPTLEFGKIDVSTAPAVYYRQTIK